MNEVEELAKLQARVKKADGMIDWVSSQEYLDSLQGSIGADWIHR